MIQLDTVVADLVLGGEVLDDGGDVEVAAVPDHRPGHLHHQVPHTQLPALGIHKLLVMIIQLTSHGLRGHSQMTLQH